MPMTAMRPTRLPSISGTGQRAAGSLSSVSHKPPKKIAPRPAPMMSASTKPGTSFIMFFLFLLNDPPFPVNPVPRIQAAQNNADQKQHQSPGKAARPVGVNPDADEDAQQRGNRHRPANNAEHAQAKPDRI